MAKRHEFPESKSLQARIACVVHALSECRMAVGNVQTVLEALPDAFPANIRERLETQLKEAIEATELASEAIHGE